MRNFVLLLGLCFFTSFIQAEFTYDEDNQLKNFARLVGGKWWLGDSSYQTFEWGIAETQIKVQRVLVEEGNEIIVTEGFFYYAPDALSIKGIAISLLDFREPQLLEYIGTTTPETFELMYKSISPDGTVVVYNETWTRKNDDHYLWRLESFDDDTSVVTGEYIRNYKQQKSTKE